MKENEAAEPKAGLAGVTARMQQAIEDQIVALSQGVTDCIEVVRTSKPKSGFDDTRSTERRDAVLIVEATATMLQAISKLKGEFRHDYHVTRMEDPLARKPKLKVGWSGDETELLTQVEYDALSEWEQIDYNRWTDGYPPRFGGWKKSRTERRKPRGDAISADAQIEQTATTAGTSPLPPKNRGSNADARDS